MATPKFPLKMQDGAQVRSIEGLRDHADLWTLEQGFRSGRLVRWLTVWYYEDLAEALRRLEGEGSGLRQRLCSVLGIPYSEHMEAAYRAKAAEVKAAEAKAAEAPEAPAEEPTVPEPPAARRPVVMSDDVADRIADLINYKGGGAACYETEDYILCFSASANPALLNTPLTKKAADICSKSANPFWLFSAGRMLFPNLGVDLKISKRTGTAEDFIIPVENKENYPMRTLVDSNCAVCGNSIIYSTNGKLLMLNIETAKVTVLEEGLVNKIAKTASGSTIAFCDKNGLCLYNVETKEKNRITAHGKMIMAGGLCLTDDVLYFICQESRGNLSDGENPNHRICMYDRNTCKSKALSNVLPEHRLDSDQITFKSIDYCMHRLIYSYRIQSSSTHEYFVLDLTTKEICPLLEESNEIMEVYTFHDGYLVFDSSISAGTIGYFVDCSTCGSPIKLADNFDLRCLSVYRLGNWFYYTTRESETTHRWKVSLDAPMKPIELECPD